MSVRVGIGGGASGLTPAQVQAIVQAELAGASISSQAPKFASDPSGLSIGDEYFNTSDNKLYVLTPNGFEPIETGEDEWTEESW